MHFVRELIIVTSHNLMRARAGKTLEENARTSAIPANLHPIGACLLNALVNTLGQHIRKWAPHASEHEHMEPIGLNKKYQHLPTKIHIK